MPRAPVRRNAARALLAVLILLLAGCAGRGEGRRDRVLPEGAETFSLLGKPLFPPELGPEEREKRRANLERARAAYKRDPSDVDAIIWLGRRTAYLGRYRDAVTIFTGGIRRFPQEPRLYRHRGHRYITLRRFEDAIWDLDRAARLVEGQEDRVEPDGLPNARNEPRSTLQTNIGYHLGLARFLRAEYREAQTAYRECRRLAANDDMLVAVSHWLWMTQRRLGLPGEAEKTLVPIRADMDVIENHDYHRLLLLYKGEIEPEELLEQFLGQGGEIGGATIGFGLANWFRVTGERRRAEAILERIVAETPWPAFGHIAAEADLARRGGR